MIKNYYICSEFQLYTMKAIKNILEALCYIAAVVCAVSFILVWVEFFTFNGAMAGYCFIVWAITFIYCLMYWGFTSKSMRGGG